LPLVRCPQKRTTAVFRVISHFAWRKSATKFLCVKTVSDEVVIGIHWPNYPFKNDWWGRPCLPEILGETDRVGAKSPISIFARSACAVTPNH